MIRDKKYLKFLRTEPCLITGLRATEDMSVVAHHVGTAGKGIKSPDNEAIPLRQDRHRELHQIGEVEFYRQHLPNFVLLAAMKAYAREIHAQATHHSS